MKLKHVMGTVTIVAIVGGTIYAIKKSKDLKKSEEEAISLEEARDIVANNQELDSKREEDMYDTYEEFEEMVEDIRDEASFNRSFMRSEPEKNEAYGRVIKGIGYDTFSEQQAIEDAEEFEEDEDEYEPLQPEPQIESYPLGEFKNEGEHVLRYEPSSQEALEQYIRMELAEWLPLEDTYSTLSHLFQFPFQPQNDGDEMLRTALIDYRVQFFGFNSKWVKEITITDLILHYARAAQYNCNNTVKYWAEYILAMTEIDYTTPSSKVEYFISKLNNHTYYNEERQTFGLFGIDHDHMDQAIAIADRNVDRSVTYEIEFNEFLKSQF